MTEQMSLFDDSVEPSIGDVESWCVSHGLTYVVGVDEAGRGPLAGPVYAAAVILDLDDIDADWVELLDDSKKLTHAEREEAAELIRQNATAFAVRSADQTVIDEINILQATLQAMAECVEVVASEIDNAPERVFVDGKITLDVTYPQQALVGGDGRSRSIAAASILAKTERDAYMVALDAEWPDYGFAGHKGYPTKKHRDAIKEFGPCPHHRLTFGCVAEFVDMLRPETDAAT